MSVQSIEILPREVMGEVLKSLVQVTGSSIVHKVDIPVIFKYVASLASTSKKMRELVHHKEVINALFQALCTKYRLSVEGVAVRCYSPIAQARLLQVCEKNGDLQVDDATQRILKIMEKVHNKEATYLIGHPLRSTYIRGSSGTLSGFELHCSSRRFVEKLCTPLGEIHVPDGIKRSDPSSFLEEDREASQASLAVTERMLNALCAKFERISLDDSDRERTVFEVIPPEGPLDNVRVIDKSMIRHLSKEDLSSRIGAQHLIWCTYGWSVYRIMDPQGVVTAPVVLPAIEAQSRDPETLELMRGYLYLQKQKEFQRYIGPIQYRACLKKGCPTLAQLRTCVIELLMDHQIRNTYICTKR